jgi:hypothetical protein
MSVVMIWNSTTFAVAKFLNVVASWCSDSVPRTQVRPASQPTAVCWYFAANASGMQKSNCPVKIWFTGIVPGTVAATHFVGPCAGPT